MGKFIKWGLPALALVVLAAGWWLGLAWAPPDREMGDVQRIMYVHVPLQWVAMVAMAINFVVAIGYLMKASWKLDATAEASAEIGLVLGTAGMITGAIWGRPTWGVYWSWDPRLTSQAIMLVTYTGYLVLRRFVEDPEKRATWSAVVAIIGAINLPIVWFSVRWWRSLHQVQSTPKTVDPEMTLALRVSAFGMLFLTLWFLVQRYRQALAERQAEVALPDALPSDLAAAGGANSSRVA
ncbi:cytochrome c biogenesis protein CcsA [Myxococcus sp. AM009]|uniref:cytochrome c biogenesis protein CcsA n=1 Tax=unclassified Myxococcus TaxID=2648731 RepID=UPI0015956C8C|nr:MULTISPECIES: cytochrome c biogenesis protein CcsA [unclassified Myxococcus]NVI99956.1 cytochrome c biogenesis protein CcsA [Myxococcus sp. AM009]NVJ17171.1 cytochrome c biogenesis protein CcsA [Myxococcus sp. AM010]